ncbi:MAG: Ras family protein [Thermoplasmata archaeon]
MEKNVTLWKVGILGERGVGKTSLINRFVFGSFPQNGGDDLSLQLVRKKIDCNIANLEVLFQEMDPGNLSPKKVENSKALILVSDVTRMESLDTIEKIGKRALDINPKVNIVIVGNKSDLKYMAEFWVEEIKCVSDNLNAILYGVVSAKTGENVEDGFKIMCKKIMKGTNKV